MQIKKNKSDCQKGEKLSAARPDGHRFPETQRSSELLFGNDTTTNDEFVGKDGNDPTLGFQAIWVEQPHELRRTR